LAQLSDEYRPSETGPHEAVAAFTEATGATVEVSSIHMEDTTSELPITATDPSAVIQTATQTLPLEPSCGVFATAAF